MKLTRTFFRQVSSWSGLSYASGVLVRNTIALHGRRRGSGTIEPVRMSTSNTTIADKEIKGRWAGWLVDQEAKRINEGNRMCMSCNASGSMILTPAFIYMCTFILREEHLCQHGHDFIDRLRRSPIPRRTLSYILPPVCQFKYACSKFKNMSFSFIHLNIPYGTNSLYKLKIRLFLESRMLIA